MEHNQINLHIIDTFIIILYFLITLLIAKKFARNEETKKQWFLSSRKLTLPLFITTLVATWYGGVLGIGEFAYNFGLLHLFVNGIPYYFFAGIFAIFFARKVWERNESLNLAEEFEKKWSPKVGKFAGFYIFLFANPVTYILITAQLFNILFNFSDSLSMFLISTLILVILWNGNLNLISHNNYFDFILMFIGFIIINIFSFIKIGNFSNMTNSLPENMLKANGGNSYYYMFSWFFIAMWTIIDPSFQQITKSAKSVKTAQIGIFSAILFWLFFDIMTLTAAFSAKYFLPDLTSPLLSYPLLADKILPIGMKGIFYAGLFATVISTLFHNCFISSATFGENILPNIMPNNKLRFKARYRCGLIVNIAIATLLIFFINSVFELWYFLGSVMIPALLIPMLANYYPNIINLSEKSVRVIMFFVPILTVCYYYLKRTIVFSENNFEPIFFGLFLTFLIMIIEKLYVISIRLIKKIFVYQVD